MKKIFEVLDYDEATLISAGNLKKIIKELGITIDEGSLQEMIDRADLDKDGLVSEEDFYAIITNKKRY